MTTYVIRADVQSKSGKVLRNKQLFFLARDEKHLAVKVLKSERIILTWKIERQHATNYAF